MRRDVGKFGLKGVLIAIAFGFSVHSSAMDRWAALSQIESGDNDCAIGTAGEVSRYQVRPEVWREHARATADWQKPEDALAVAQGLMKERCEEFEKLHGRPPTDFEFYILWNAPAQIKRPSKVVRERAKRFCNLVAMAVAKRDP
jgi:hypothetical protein